MDKKLIKISYEIITPESAEQGDVAERGWEDEEGVDVSSDSYKETGEEVDTEDDETSVDNAIRFLKEQGVDECSSIPFVKGSWYIANGSQDMDGSYTNRFFHLYGFTKYEENEIYHNVFKKNESKLNINLLSKLLEDENGSYVKGIISEHEIDSLFTAYEWMIDDRSHGDDYLADAAGKVWDEMFPDIKPNDSPKGTEKQIMDYIQTSIQRAENERDKDG